MTTLHSRASIARRTYIVALAVVAIVAACDSGPTDPLQVKPPCIAPAPLQGKFTSQAPGFIVAFDDDVNPVTETARLANHYGFTARHVYTAIPGFAADLSPSTVAALRCERSVSFITYNGVVTLD